MDHMENDFLFAGFGQPLPGNPPKPGDVRCPEEQLCDRIVALGRSNHVKDRFLATLAHELRTPLASILNGVELLRSREPGSALEVIERQARHMARLVDDIMDISRVSNGKITLNKVTFDLVQTIRETAQAAVLIIKKEHNFTTILPTEPLWVEADPVRIAQVVTNLLSNAVKYSDPKKACGPISLNLRREENQALLQVCDQGIGIPSEMLERIFEPFVQLESSVAQSRGGLGLGLALVRQLVALHGGTVTVESEGPGCGSEFSVRLPLASSPSSVQEDRKLEGKSASPASLPPKAHHRVLLVEDNADMASTLGRLIAAWGHTVEVVPNGTVALAKALEFCPDIALVDIGLPGIDGWAVANQLAKAPQLKNLHIIAMSGYGQESDRLRATEAGFEEYMLKPVDPETLRNRLAHE